MNLQRVHWLDWRDASNAVACGKEQAICRVSGVFGKHVSCANCRRVHAAKQKAKR